MRTDTSFLTANMSYSAFAESKTMGQSSRSVVLRGQSAFFSVVVVSRSSCSLLSVFFVISRLDRRGQSSWSVVLRGQSAFFLVVVSSRFSRSVSRLGPRAQSSWSVIFSWSVSVLLGRREQSSSWSVVLLGWCLYSMVVMRGWNCQKHPTCVVCRPTERSSVYFYLNITPQPCAYKKLYSIVIKQLPSKTIHTMAYLLWKITAHFMVV